MIKRLLTALVLIPLVLALISKASTPLFLLFLALFLAPAWWEFSRLSRSFGGRPGLLSGVATLVFPWIWVYLPQLLPAYLLAAFLLLALLPLRKGVPQKARFPSAAFGLFPLLYLSVPFGIAAELQGSRAEWLVALLVWVWLSDIAAFYVGRAWGRHKVTPELSPGKSAEGFAAGLLAPLLGALLSAPWLVLSPGKAALLGLAVGGAGIAGDLFESALKRGAGVKDSSRLLPGHGGVLDRIDSLLFALPAFWLLEGLLQWSSRP